MEDRKDPVTELTRVICDACQALGIHGEPVKAAQIAARGFVAIRHTHPDEAQRINVMMHRLARMEAQQEALPPTGAAPVDTKEGTARE